MPTLVCSADSESASAAQVAASHQASSRGVPRTARSPEPTAAAVSASVTVNLKVALSPVCIPPSKQVAGRPGEADWPNRAEV